MGALDDLEADYQSGLSSPQEGTPGVLRIPISNSIPPSSLDQLEAEYQASIPRTWGDTATNLGQSLAKGAYGAADLANTILNPNILGSKLASLVTGNPAFPNSNDLSEAERKYYIGDPDYSKGSLGEKVAGGALESAPYAVFGGGILPAALAGAGGQLGEAAGLPNWMGQVAGGFTPSGIDSALAHLGPQTAEGAKAYIGKVLAKYVNGDDVNASLEALRGDPLAGAKSSAEVTNSPELALLEQSMGSGTKSLDYAARAANRTEAQGNVLNNISTSRDALPEETGQTIQSQIQDARDASWKNVNDLYDQIPENVTAKVYPLKIAVQDAKQQYFGPGAPPVPSKLNGIIDFLTDSSNKNQIDISALQRARSHALDIADTASAAGNKQEGALATAVASNIADTLSNAPKGADEWIAANKAAADHYNTFDNGPLGNVNNNNILPSRVPAKVLSSPEAASQYANIVGSDPAKLGAIKDQIATDLGGMSDTQKMNFINNNESGLKTLLGNDFNPLDSIRNDITSRISTQKLANATAGPNTALKLSDVVQRAMGNKTTAKQSAWQLLAEGAGVGGLSYAHPYLGLPIAAADVGRRVLRDRSANLVGDSLFHALINPNNLQDALTAGANARTPYGALGVSPALESIAGGAASSGSGSIGLPLSISKQQNILPQSPSQSPSIPVNTPSTNTPGVLRIPISNGALGRDPNQVNSLIQSQHPLIQAMIKTEARNQDPNSLSPKGAVGLMQLMPGAAKDMGVTDRTDPVQSIQGGTKYLSGLLDKYKDKDLALTAYNAGPGTVDTAIRNAIAAGRPRTLDGIRDYLPTKEAKDYANKVNANLLSINGGNG